MRLCALSGTGLVRTSQAPLGEKPEIKTDLSTFMKKFLLPKKEFALSGLKFTGKDKTSHQSQSKTSYIMPIEL
jgi:hypothetical protein